MNDYSPNIDPQKPKDTQPKAPDFTETSESIKHFLRRIFDLQSDVDKAQTKQEIKGNISFAGMQVYVLIASIIIASIGLNANSTAVVIGAMLISPLMGPIVGFGYGIAVNDYVTLRRSLMNFAVMVVIALLTSFIFFALIPGGSFITPELRGRIEPTALDVMIAVAGGFAGIVGASSKNKNVNVVAGVAIATALMPPLCTVGYGLSVGFDQVGYKEYSGFQAALNAFYLFFINCTFISISTFLFVKVLRFPMSKYIDAAKRKRTNLLIAVAAVLVMVPSGFIFSKIFIDANYNRKIKVFLDKEINAKYPDSFIGLESTKPTDGENGGKILYITALKGFSNEKVEEWNTTLKTDYGVENTALIVRQSGMSAEQFEQMNEDNMQFMFSRSQDLLVQKDSIIQSLNHQIKTLKSDSIPFTTISRELKSQYKNLENFGYGNYSYTDFNLKEVIIPTFSLRWKNDTVNLIPEEKQLENENRIKDFLKARLNLDTIQLFHEKLE